MKIIDSDFSNLEGTNCYCDPESADTIRKSISSMETGAIHMIGTGDYHYISLFWLERLEEPYTLVLFDNHPDDQAPAFGSDILSCGSWVAESRKLPMQRSCTWINGVRPPEEIPEGIPVYLSIDLDVLSRDYAATDWSQGEMSLDEMGTLIKGILSSHRLLGADICGGLTIQKGASPDDLALNARTEKALSKLIIDSLT